MTDIDTDLDRASWLEWRRHGIGGSDIAILMGISRYDTPYGLWLDKTGRRTVEKADFSGRMAMGKRMEATITKFFEEDTGYIVRDAQAQVVHSLKPWIRVTLDGFVHDGDGYLMGVGEWKCTTQPEVKVMPMHVAQVQWQLLATSLPVGWLAVLRNGNEFTIHRIEEDKEYQNRMQETAARFWYDNVLADVPPPVGAFDGDALNSTRPHSGESVDLPSQLYDDLVKARRIKKAAEEDVSYAENAIKALMVDAEAGMIGGKAVVTWAPRVQYRLDTTALKRDLPEIADKYLKPSESRVFTVKGEK